MEKPSCEETMPGCSAHSCTSKRFFRRHFVTENNARHREVKRAEIFHGNNGDVKRLHTSPLWSLKRQGFAIFRHVNKLRNLVVAGVLFQGRAGQQTVVNRLHVGRHNLCFGQREVGFSTSSAPMIIGPNPIT